MRLASQRIAATARWLAAQLRPRGARRGTALALLVLAHASAAACSGTADGPTASARPANSPATSALPAYLQPADSPPEPVEAASTVGPVTDSAPVGVVPMRSGHSSRASGTAEPPVAAPGADAADQAPSHPVPRRALLAFTGDVLSHGPVTQRARANGSDGLRYDYRPMFAQVRDTIAAADLAICHLESPLSADNTDLSSYPLFNAPGDLAAALADAGYDGCSVASNHSVDRGVEGIAETLATLERFGLGHAGMARTPEEAATPVLYRAGGIVIGHLSYTYGLNGLRLPQDRSWAVDVIDPDAIVAEAQAAVDAGAEFVVLSLQWGWEYTSTPGAEQRRLAAELLADESIDLIVGSHAHVVQPVDRVDGKHVLYGVGNFLTNQSPQTCRSCPLETVDGVIMEVQLTETPAGRIEVAALSAVPTWIERPTFEIVDVAAELAGDLGPNRRGVLQRSWQRTARVLRSAGADVVIKGDPAATAGRSGVPDRPALWPGAER